MQRNKQNRLDVVLSWQTSQRHKSSGGGKLRVFLIIVTLLVLLFFIWGGVKEFIPKFN